jgi:hypothetical protein
MNCLKCKKTIESNRKFCSRSCSNSINNKKRSPELKRKLTEAAAKYCKGKTLEEKCGLEKAQEIKKKMSLNNSGENNPNYNGIYRGTRVVEKGKKYNEIYGEKKSNLIKEKLSKANSGSNNPMYGIPSPKKTGNGWSGHYKNYYFRSLLELSYLKYLINNNIEFDKGENKNYQVKYELNGIERTYHPDFFLIKTSEVIELKPKKIINSYINKIKFENALKKFGSNFKVLTEDDVKILNKDELAEMKKNKELKFDKNKIKKINEYFKKNK